MQDIWHVTPMLRATVPESFEKKYSTDGLPRSGGLWARLWGDFLGC